MSLMEGLPQKTEEITFCIDRGLDRVGTDVKYLVYWHLQSVGHVKRSEIVAKPEEFVSALKGLYRESSTVVERAIVQELNATFGLDFEPTQLAKAIVKAKEKLDYVKVV
jgi:hypothetical protein